MLYHVFDDLVPEKYKQIDLLPKDLKEQIEETNEWTYNDVNNGRFYLGRHGVGTELTAFRCLQKWLRNVCSLRSTMQCKLMY